MGDTSLLQPAVMINLLGEKGFSGKVVYRGLQDVMKMGGVHVHLYGKSEARPFRKMGHVTIVHPELEVAKKRARDVMSTLKVES